MLCDVLCSDLLTDLLPYFLLTSPLAPAVTFNQDVLQCSETELSEGLVCFITELKRPDGQPYPPDCLFCLCLSIQQVRPAAPYTDRLPKTTIIWSKMRIEETNSLF